MELEQFIKEALKEDRAFDDITSHLFVPGEKKVKASIIAQQDGVLAGLSVVQKVFFTVDKSIEIAIKREDGQNFQCNEEIAYIVGNARSILAAERTALNFLGHLSGIATLTAKFVREIEGSGVKILDTRKTTPLMRTLEKEAIRLGGGINHRMNLAEKVLLKDNHIKAIGGIEEVAKKVQMVKLKNPKLFIEVEVSGLDELRIALHAEPSRIMLDNFSVKDVKEAVELRKQMAKTYIPFEISGGINELNIVEYANCGCEYISIGALTHSASAVNFSLEFLNEGT